MKILWKKLLYKNPGHYLTFDQGSCTTDAYWKLKACPHEDSMEKTVVQEPWPLPHL